jgi:hypothetical protein
VLTNLDRSRLPTVVAYRVLDALLALDPIPWGDRFREYQNARERAHEGRVHPRSENMRSARRMDEYAGRYTHPAYGGMELRASGERLVLDYHEFSTPLLHVHHEVFEAPPDRLNRLERMRVTFEADGSGGINRVLIPLEPRVADIVFARVVDGANLT